MKIEKGKLYKDALTGKLSVHFEDEDIWSDKIAVHCKTQEDWDYVAKSLRIIWASKEKFNRYGSETVMYVNENFYGNIKFTELDYHIIFIDQFKEFYPEEENYDNVQNNRHKCLDKAKDILDNLPNELTAKFGEGGDIDLKIDRGHKESDNKLNYELDFDFITQMSERMQTNKGKYEPYNWKKPINVEELKQALFRHVIEVMKGNYQDDGRLHGHLEAISLNAMMLNYQLKLREG